MGEHDWVAIAVGVLGILAAVYFYVKQKRKVQITYSIDKTQLLGSERGVLPGEVTIVYEDVKITDLIKFNAIFWNSGTEPIRRQDIIEPMLLSFSAECNLLKASVLKSSRPQNRVVLTAVDDNHEMHFDFEYLEPRQGFNVELLVTGKTTDQPIPTGTIIGMPNGFRKFDERKRWYTARIVMDLGYIVVMAGSIVTINVFNVSINFVIWIWAFLVALVTVFAFLWPRRQGIPSDLRT